MNAQLIRYPLNPKLTISACQGHFATRHSHNSHYLDVTAIKHQHTMAQNAAVELAQRYIVLKNVDAIVCLDGSEMLGAFLAQHLAKQEFLAINRGKTINVVTPEYDPNGQLIFRDNLLPMVKNQDVVVLISTVNSGKTVSRTLRCMEYYGARTQAVVSVFSALEQVMGLPVFSLFHPGDIPGYTTSPASGCPLCAAGKKLDGIANSYGVSRL